MNLTTKQKEGLKKSQARMNIFEGAVRSGKSVIANIRWLDYMINDAPKTGDFVFTGVSNDSIIRNIVEPLKQFVGKELNYTNNPLKIKLWGRLIHGFGAGSAKSFVAIQGSEFAGCLSDELTRHHKSFVDMMGTRLSIEGAKWFATCNPDHPKHYVKKEFIDNKKRNLYVQSYQLFDNPYLPKDYVKDLSTSYTGVFYDRYILGKWVQGHGVIYDFFGEQNIIKNKDMQKAEHYVLSIDYGTMNPFSCGLYGINHKVKPKIWRIDEYYYCGREEEKSKTDYEYGDDIDNFVDNHGVRNKLYAIIVDPSAKSFITELEKRGYSVIPANNSVLDGIRLQSAMLKNGEYMVGEKCQHCIDEYSAYIWDENAIVDTPVKENDHTKDEERYVLMTIFKENILDYVYLTN